MTHSHIAKIKVKAFYYLKNKNILLAETDSFHCDANNATHSCDDFRRSDFDSLLSAKQNGQQW